MIIETVEQIQQDFEQGNAPFDDVTFPEERLLDELPHNSMEDRAILASIFATFDYNRDANRLTDNLIELHEYHRQWFDASYVDDEPDEDILADAFSEIGFRYPSRDAHAWYVNCAILQEKYSGKWTELLLSVSADAPTLVQRLNEDDFLCIKGVKIAPMYARIINDDVAPLSNLWELDIPVDTHIRRLTKELFAGSMIASETWLNKDDDNIRSIWREVARKHDIDRAVVDGALWHIGNKWDDWGEDYWQDVNQKD